MVGIETDRGPWVQALLAAGYHVHAINPLQVARYRQTEHTSGGKSDAADAHTLADMVRTKRHTLRPVAGDSPSRGDQGCHSDAQDPDLGTHKDIHVAAVVTTLGAQVVEGTFPTIAAGYRRLLAWARSYGGLDRAGVEGTGSYGAALTRYLRRSGLTVIEVNRPDRAARRSRGKTDAIDAVAAARAVLSQRAATTAKTADGPVEMLRMFSPGPRLRGEVSHPGDQPAQRRHRRRRPRAA
jgi:transposase